MKLSAAEGTRDHAAPAWEAVADTLGLGEGVRTLDVGCGTGGFCAFAADRRAEVHGLDIDAHRIATARRRAPDAAFRVGDMERLPWTDGEFDVVTGFNAFQYAAAPARALFEARRMVRGGGSVVVCKWAEAEANELFLLLAAVRRAEVAPAGRRPSCGTAAIEKALRYCGLDPVDHGEVTTSLTFSDVDTLTEALVGSGGFPQGLSPAHVHRSAATFEQPDGTYRLNGALVHVAAQRLR